MNQSSKVIAILCVLIFSITSCGKKEDDPAVVSTLTMTCVSSEDPESPYSPFVRCYELTFQSDKIGYANTRCQFQENIFPGKTCGEVVSENLATPYSAYLGSCAFTDLLDGLTVPGGGYHEINYYYGYSTFNNESTCTATSGVWTAPTP